MSDRRRLAIEISAILLAVLAVFVCFYMFKSFSDGTLTSILQKHLVLALVCIFSVYLLKPFLFFVPSAVQMSFTGILFPWYIAIVVNLIGVAVEMMSGYFIGFIFGKKLVEKLTEKSKIIRTVKEKYLKDDFNTIFITHFVPVFPFDNISMLYGANNTNLMRYVVISVLGLSPRVIAYSISGSAVTDPLSPQFIIPLVVVGLFSFGVSMWFNKKEANKINQ